MNQRIFTLSETAEILNVDKETLRRWDNSGKLKSIRNPINNYREYRKEDITIFEKGKIYFNENNHNHVNSIKPYKSIELFAGAGGLALGLEKAGIHHSLLNEIDKYAVQTLKKNRPRWNIKQGDIQDICFKKYKNKIDLLTGGFPCQAFSYAGKKLGFEDTRGTLFFEFARALKETNAPVFLAENVKGLLSHEKGKTLETMIDVLDELGYHVFKPQVLKAIHYKVPQKRERLIIIGMKKEYLEQVSYSYPEPYEKIYTLKDALKKGELFDCDVPQSVGQKYPERKKAILDMVPPGGYWRDLPLDIQKEYMQKSFYLGGGKTGMARRISWDEPSLTLTCSPAQKQTERCHPDETRPFQVREYARIQTFPDDWIFEGSQSQQYKQIGNAVPVNLAEEIGYSIIKLLNDIEKLKNSKFC
ncbi:DNA (cytosine-5-)-methyltransferase [Candidatus Marinarcus aquaticus]|uniref:Cytosine-specific methyltransferase n=1 Tax=Candidatus Marinarcus aquaticus TaxID=2044504 RepID=A0A4Q0XVG4_9BACT|nr:DNA (cytosine-5-)-methyltransferase [Candidatus Marinarcus aquaticus]RXJ58173.1 DNA (cytosine-5-)-methyltransferase [Candidatus Marinarcus aquaticus]